jgi:catechol 2,3-dioxygenase-like lactoylglutathione lyase family enzyme
MSENRGVTGNSPDSVPVLRVARPSNDLAALKKFYVEGLGLVELASFTAHAGFDGLVVGALNAPYHLEFTVEQGVTAARASSKEQLIVFYLPDEQRFLAAVARMKRIGATPVASHNPYWDQVGVTFEDPDGYRVVLQRAAWAK